MFKVLQTVNLIRNTKAVLEERYSKKEKEEIIEEEYDDIASIEIDEEKSVARVEIDLSGVKTNRVILDIKYR